jgi:methylphosphotriester-DNA--protein-cysteine methyltransferase
MSYKLLDRNGKVYLSDVPGMFGGHRQTKIYGKLYCRSALLAISKGGYVDHRVFFADEETAVTAGYRPCGVCCPEEYKSWKASRVAPE